MTTQEAGRLTSAGLSVAIPPGYETGYDDFQSAFDFHEARRDVAYGYYSEIAVGRLSFAEGFTQLSTTATQMMQCWASGDHWPMVGHVELIEGEQISVSGRVGWHVRWEIFYNNDPIPGEILDVIVVDMGPGADYFGLYLSCRPTGDPDFEASISSAISSLQII